jgi:hypothetical protein
MNYTISQWKLIQTKLKVLGYYKGVVDGIAGIYTIQAIKLFQKAKGLLQDGIVGPVTLKSMGITIVKPVPPVVAVIKGPVQKAIETAMNIQFTHFTEFYNFVKTSGKYSHYFDDQFNWQTEVNKIKLGLNCVDFTQLGMKLAIEMGYTVVPYGVYCAGDGINHAIFLIKGNEFTSDTWVDLSAAASSNYSLGKHWCNGKLTERPRWIPFE